MEKRGISTIARSEVDLICRWMNEGPCDYVGAWPCSEINSSDPFTRVYHSTITAARQAASINESGGVRYAHVGR